VLDLVSVWFQLRFGRKPMLFFGLSGAALMFFGFLVGVYAVIERYVYGHGNRAFLYLVLLLVIAGLALFGFGFVGELVPTCASSCAPWSGKWDGSASAARPTSDDAGVGGHPG